jgi:DNA-binding response OmpR family regulator
MDAKRIIIVDDDRDLREMLRLRLEMTGYDVSVASNGLRLLSSLKVDRPDLILLDVMMSWINGFELCLALKQNPDYAKIPVFFVSALSSEEDIEKGLACGCTRYFTKPLDLDELLTEIRQVLA